MKKKHILMGWLCLVMAAGCGPKIKIQNLTATPIVNPYGEDIIKKGNLTKAETDKWMLLDLEKDTIPGASIYRLYKELLIQIQPVSKTVVAVIDTGIDINHEDLKDIIWTNENEIAGNGIDDDKNGYIDDIHGWNFLGDSDKETLEMVRIVRSGNKVSEDYKRAKEAYERKLGEAQMSNQNASRIYQGIQKADSLMLSSVGKSDYTIKELTEVIRNQDGNQYDKFLRFAMFGVSMNTLRDEIKRAKDHYGKTLDYSLKMDFYGRVPLGDDPNDFSVSTYGNANVIGPNIDSADHGTHCSGIIAAFRENGKGMDGIANHVKIMPIRTVPINGDEYDKDVAMAIRYATDNGAKIINCSFGKGFSPHVDKVQEALKYAASKDVLVVIGAGNDSKNVDLKKSFPTDVSNGVEMTNNVITVGAITSTYGKNMVGGVSNYGQKNVDIFAPGDNIYSTTPHNGYKHFSGTSMAAPVVSGVAGLIRSYYPQLTVVQVKEIILRSGLKYSGKVSVGKKKLLTAFSEISKTGRFLNGYNAFLLANQVASGKVKL